MYCRTVRRNSKEFATVLHTPGWTRHSFSQDDPMEGEPAVEDWIVRYHVYKIIQVQDRFVAKVDGWNGTVWFELRGHCRPKQVKGSGYEASFNHKPRWERKGAA